MDDLISRAAAIEYLMTNMGWHDEDGYPVDDSDEKRAIITDLVNGIPSVDVVPVVRCRDCKYSDTFTDTTTATTPLKCLNIRYGGVYPDWYCEHGERRDDDADD